MKLAIGDELQTLFHPAVKATKQAAEENRKELAPMKKTLTDIDGAVNRVTDAKASKYTTFGFYMNDGQRSMGFNAVQQNGKTLIVDDTEHILAPGIRALITLKKAFMDTGGIDINALIDGSGIVVD